MGSVEDNNACRESSKEPTLLAQMLVAWTRVATEKTENSMISSRDFYIKSSDRMREKGSFWKTVVPRLLQGTGDCICGRRKWWLATFGAGEEGR